MPLTAVQLVPVVGTVSVCHVSTVAGLEPGVIAWTGPVYPTASALPAPSVVTTGDSPPTSALEL